MYSLPNAKINIGLHIINRRSDGYHNLQTVFYPIPLADSLEIKEAKRLNRPYEFIVSGLDIPDDGRDNIVVRVFLSMQKEFGLPPTSIFLSKHIPAGAGLGGGSSDAASMMQLLNDYYRLGLAAGEMEQRLSAFGADCPFFIRNKAVLAEGIGNEFTPINLSLADMYIVLVKPDVHISTPDAYANITPRGSQADLARLLLDTPVSQWRDAVSNDFENYVFSSYPSVAAIKQTLYDIGAVYASMSGSGSAVYGLFSRPVDNAATIFSDCFCLCGKMP